MSIIGRLQINCLALWMSAQCTQYCRAAHMSRVCQCSTRDLAAIYQSMRAVTWWMNAVSMGRKHANQLTARLTVQIFIYIVILFVSELWKLHRCGAWPSKTRSKSNANIHQIDGNWNVRGWIRFGTNAAETREEDRTKVARKDGHATLKWAVKFLLSFKSQCDQSMDHRYRRLISYKPIFVCFGGDFWFVFMCVCVNRSDRLSC